MDKLRMNLFYCCYFGLVGNWHKLIIWGILIKDDIVIVDYCRYSIYIAFFLAIRSRTQLSHRCLFARGILR